MVSANVAADLAQVSLLKNENCNAMDA